MILSWRDFQRLAVAFAAALIGLHSDAAGKPVTRPNFVFIFTDDQQFAALGSNGNPHVQTPHLDAFAEGAVRFENAYAVFAVFALCAPSRAAVLTGQYGSRDRSGLRENTWVIVMSDNGWLLGEHGMTSKILAYEESIRVPLLIAGPGMGSGVRDGIALNIDIAPTILDLAEVAVPKEMQGRSLVPLLEGGGDDWREVFVYEGLGTYANLKPHLAAVGKRWKLIRTLDGKDTGRVTFDELYDLKNDSGEMENLARKGEHAEIEAKLNGVIDRHLAEMGLPPLRDGE